MRRGFTLMEILVSVLLISIVILGIAKIRERNIEMSRYIAGRMQSELANTLFLKKEFMKYNRSDKNAYDLLRPMGIDSLKTREILRKERRYLRVSDPLPLGEEELPMELRAFYLKGRFSSTYYRIFF
jgi:prepilin-type N-terminal cleavage/methylation domain-containing protein